MNLLMSFYSVSHLSRFKKYLSPSLYYLIIVSWLCPGSAKANGREPKTYLGRVFNYKLGRFNDVNVFVYVDARPHLQLKTQPRFSPVS